MYSLALDNSWAIMDDEEMYDVNGGWGILSFAKKAFNHAWSSFTGAVYTATAAALKVNVSVLSGMTKVGYMVNGYKGVIQAIFYDIKLVLVTALLLAASIALYLFNNGYIG